MYYKKKITTDVLQSCGIPMMVLVTSNELASTASERCSFTRDTTVVSFLVYNNIHSCPLL